MEWLSHNIPVVMLLLGQFIAFVTLVVTMRNGITANALAIENQNKVIADQDKETDGLKALLAVHMANTAIHIDPARDKQVWDNFQRDMAQQFEKMDKRFDASDRKLERLMVYVPPPSS